MIPIETYSEKAVELAPELAAIVVVVGLASAPPAFCQHDKPLKEVQHTCYSKAQLPIHPGSQLNIGKLLWLPKQSKPEIREPPTKAIMGFRWFCSDLFRPSRPPGTASAGAFIALVVGAAAAAELAPGRSFPAAEK